jgi:DNA-binding IclR family transcriptional regulator
MSSDFLKTVGKAIDVLNLFVFSKSAWGPREIARELGINKSSAHRILHTFQEKKLLRFDLEKNKFTFGSDLMRIAISLQNQNTLIQLAKPIMRRYVDDINETLTLFSYRDDKMVFECSVEADHALRFDLKLGVPYSLHVGVSGKVVLANISEEKAEALYRIFEEQRLCDVAALKRQVTLCKNHGYATAYSERIRGLMGFSAPIQGSEGAFIGGITLALPDARYNPEDHEKFCGTVVECAREISHHFNNYPPKPFGNGSDPT